MSDPSGLPPKHPYLGLPGFQFWKRSFGPHQPGGLDPVSGVKFQIEKSTRIVAAGSCFAQHLARHIKLRNFNFVVTENVHDLFVQRRYDDACAETFHYGLFSARYGNIYTARQLAQLIDRAYGRLEPIVGGWERDDGRVVDPFRPQVEPGGFINEAELVNDRKQHFAAVRAAFESADVFVFTLGLTEAWRDKRDGAVYPLAPGVAGGRYDPAIHEFVNFDVASVHDDMQKAIAALKSRNPAMKMLVTVSPVPLNATFEPRHVLQSTVYSKSVLRVVAQMLADQHDFVDYFPSFEIITSPQCGGRYFFDDMRSIREEGVQHVMDVFFSHYVKQAFEEVRPPTPAPAAGKPSDHVQAMERLVRILCDEEAIDSSTGAGEKA